MACYLYRRPIRRGATEAKGRHRLTRSPALLLVFAALMLALAPAMARAREPRPAPRYSLTVLGTLGGSVDQAAALNDRGLVAGFSTLAGDQVTRASIWDRGVVTDLGTLGGPSSNVSEGYPVNNRGIVVGYSQTSTPDPSGEDFCGFLSGGVFGGTCLPFVWQDGTMRSLPTLGGGNGLAAAINDAGLIVGTAETGTPETACAPVLNSHFEGVLWRRGIAHQLAPLPGDTDSSATAVNNAGEIVGVSAPDCTSPAHAVLWQDGRPVDLGTLGGATANIAFGINDRGQIVGQSDLSGDQAHEAFLWQNGRMAGLGTILGLPDSLANAINDSGQVVGFSQDQNGANSTAWIWQKGTMTDLNTLIGSAAPMYLQEALGVNRRGEIAGYGLLPNGDTRGYALTPCRSTTARGCGDQSASRALSSHTWPGMGWARAGLESAGPGRSSADWSGDR
jgi:probable HAF family extracellular repeat protein